MNSSKLSHILPSECGMNASINRKRPSQKKTILGTGSSRRTDLATFFTIIVYWAFKVRLTVVITTPPSINLHFEPHKLE